MSLSISELVAGVGDGKVFVQNLRENLTGVRTRTKGRESVVSFVTGSQFISPSEAVSDEPAEYVGLVLWLPTVDVERVKSEARSRDGG